MPPSLFVFYTSRAYSNNRGRTHSGCRTAADARDSEPGKRVTGAGTGIRQAAGQRKRERLTVLLHHVNVETLRAAFYALKSKAAAGSTG